MVNNLLCFILGGSGTAFITILIGLYSLFSQSHNDRKTWPVHYRACLIALVGFYLGMWVMEILFVDFCMTPSWLMLYNFFLPILLLVSLTILILSIYKGDHYK